MIKLIAIPVPKVNSGSGDHENQFSELMKEIGYACKQLKAKKWNLADYWYHMAEFFDYLGLPADAEKHRHKAKFWIQGVPEQGVRIIDPDYPDECSYINVGRRDVGIIKSIADCK